ncbi:MAG: hypothetical protein ACXV4A_04855 [Actinomycetes bacterium]
MAETTAKKAKAAAAHPGEPAKKTIPRQQAVVDRTAELSDEVLKSIEAAQRSAIEAVRKFVDTVDEALPAIGERPSRRETIIDAALDMADKLVTTQYHFLRNVVQSADRSLTRSATPKK